MTDRGLPPVDGAPACPFVAFEDDRDERAQSPDHRHRCYAEVRPAPRAIAHQEAYCLSSAFPVCPTFQDWARREAARARSEPPVAPVPVDPEPRRNPPREWTAPPPWMIGDPVSREGLPRDPSGADAGRGGAPIPPYLESEPASRGLAGSAADRLAGDVDSTGGRDRAEEPREAPAAVRPPMPPLARDLDELDDEFGASDERDDRRAAGVPHVDRSTRAADRGAVRSAPPGSRQVRPRAADPGPSWERPRRYEAYPTIRTRVGLPALPRVAIMAAALVIAALALFFLPALLGVGGPDDDGPIGGVSPSPSAAPSASVEPTPTPAPTPQTYVVAPGDTMSKIASRFEVGLDELIAANRETVPDPDRLAIGDVVIIPVPGAPLPSEPASPAVP